MSVHRPPPPLSPHVVTHHVVVSPPLLLLAPFLLVVVVAFVVGRKSSECFLFLFLFRMDSLRYYKVFVKNLSFLFFDPKMGKTTRIISAHWKEVVLYHFVPNRSRTLWTCLFPDCLRLYIFLVDTEKAPVCRSARIFVLVKMKIYKRATPPHDVPPLVFSS